MNLVKYEKDEIGQLVISAISITITLLSGLGFKLWRDERGIDQKRLIYLMETRDKILNIGNSDNGRSTIINGSCLKIKDHLESLRLQYPIDLEGECLSLFSDKVRYIIYQTVGNPQTFAGFTNRKKRPMNLQDIRDFLFAFNKLHYCLVQIVLNQELDFNDLDNTGECGSWMIDFAQSAPARQLIVSICTVNEITRECYFMLGEYAKVWDK